MSVLMTKSNGVTQVTGRKSYLTDPEFIKEFLEGIETMYYVSQAAKLTGIAPQTVNNWFKDVNEHVNLKHQDMSECDDKCGDLVAKRAFLVSVKKAQAKFTKENTDKIKTHTAKNWMAAAWLLERTQPDDFGLKQRIEHTGKDGGPITHKLLSVEARQRALEAAQNALTIETEQDEEGTFIPVQSE